MGTNLKWLRLLPCLALVFWIRTVHAIPPSAGVLDDALDRYHAVAGGWALAITNRASWLFWTLALISMVWTFGMMALRKADMGEFFAEFLRFTMFTGFFWTLLINGPVLATAIIDSLRDIAAEASGTTEELSPSSVMDIGFRFFLELASRTSIWKPIDALVGLLVGIAVLVVIALIAVNMLILLVSGWILCYAGIFFLGFGGSRWTSDMALNYYRTILNLAGQLFTMVLLVGIGTAFLNRYTSDLSAVINYGELGVVLVAAVVLLSLVTRVPGFVGGLASGGGTAALGGGYGAGSMLAAATMAGAAAATAGAAVATAAANVGGGAQALMAAFSKATQDAGSGSAARDFLPSGGDGGSGGKPSPPDSSALSKVTGESSSRSAEIAHALAEKSAAAAAGHGPSVPGGVPPASGSIDGASGAAGDGMKSAAATSSQNSSAGGPSAQQSSVGNPASGTNDISRSGIPKAAGNAGRVAIGTVGNLGQGAFDVAKQGAHNLMDKASHRMAETIPGKVAAAIKARQEEAGTTSAPSSSGTPNTISAGSMPADLEAEVAAFRDRKRDTDDEGKT